MWKCGQNPFTRRNWQQPFITTNTRALAVIVMSIMAVLTSSICQCRRPAAAAAIAEEEHNMSSTHPISGCALTLF